jgi:hypothetical protein
MQALRKDVSDRVAHVENEDHDARRLQSTDDGSPVGGNDLTLRLLLELGSHVGFL